MQPSTIHAGDTLRFLRSLPDYPAGAGWVLKHRLAPRSPAGTALVFDASPVGDDHQVNVPATVTAGWSADVYTLVAWVERGADVHTLDQTQLTVRPDPRTVGGGYDGRSMAQKALDDCRAAFATFSSTRGTQRRYKIGEREMEFNTAAEIIKQIQYWESEVNREDRKAGKRPATSGRIYTRL